MPKYNKGTKRFITLLEKEIPNFTEIVRDKIVKKVIDNKEEYTAKLIGDGMSKHLANECVNNLIAKNSNNYINEEKSGVEIISFMMKTLQILKKQEIFIDFEKLDFLFDYFNLPEIFQIDVLAYILKNNINGFKESAESIRAKEEQYEGEKLNYKEIFKEEIEIMSILYDDISKEEMEKAMSESDFKSVKDAIHEAYNTLDEYIDDDYQFVASFDLEKLFTALTNTGANLTSFQLKLIIYAVSEKQLDQIFYENEDKVAKTTPAKKTERINKTNIADIEKSRKEQNNAIQQLKVYLVNETPIKYLNDAELAEVLYLLAKAGYPDEKINTIKKNIIENNVKLEQEEIERMFLASKQKYLSIEEIDILAVAESKLNDQESCINPLFEAIKDNYEFVKEELLKLLTLEDIDLESIELIKVAIEEIKETIVNYQYSDYRYVLELTKQNSGDDINE